MTRPEITRLSNQELAVLDGAVSHRNYQPPEDELDAANRLYATGLLEQDPGFPAVTRATEAGRQRYLDELAARDTAGSAITEDVDDRGVRRMPKDHPFPAGPSFRCEYCGLRLSDLPGVNDCDCDPAGSGFLRNPRDCDYATRCATCDSAIRPVRGGWGHVWASAERSQHDAVLARPATAGK